jgi:putative DNA methylase
MIWDFAEANPFANAAGDIASASEAIRQVIDFVPAGPDGSVVQLDATATLSIGKPCVSTDPPYYDNIGYADLSDFFYVWLRRSIKGVYPSLFATALTPKPKN